MIYVSISVQDMYFSYEAFFNLDTLSQNLSSASNPTNPTDNWRSTRNPKRTVTQLDVMHYLRPIKHHFPTLYAQLHHHNQFASISMRARE